MSSDRCIPESSGTTWCGSLPAWLSSARCLSGFSNLPKTGKRDQTARAYKLCAISAQRPELVLTHYALSSSVSSTLNGLGGRKRPARKCKDGQLRGGQGSPVLTSCFNVPEAVSSRIFSDGSCAKLPHQEFLNRLQIDKS